MAVHLEAHGGMGLDMGKERTCAVSERAASAGNFAVAASVLRPRLLLVCPPAPAAPEFPAAAILRKCFWAWLATCVGVRVGI